MKAITDFQIMDHGIENSQYFQGCGTAFTEYIDVVTGIGNNPAEALDDALESLAQMGWETEGMEARICEQEGWTEFPTEPEVPDDYEDCYYHASIRVK